jgi:hypothetical protein
MTDDGYVQGNKKGIDYAIPFYGNFKNQALPSSLAFNFLAF